MKIKNVRDINNGDKIVIVDDGWSDEQLGENLNWMAMNSDSLTTLDGELVDADPIFEISDEHPLTNIDAFKVEYDVVEEGPVVSKYFETPTYTIENIDLYNFIVKAKQELSYFELIPFVNNNLVGYENDFGKGLMYFQYSELRDNVFKVNKFEEVLHIMLKWYMNEIVIEPIQKIVSHRYYVQTTDVDVDGDRQYVQLNFPCQTEFNLEYDYDGKTLFKTYEDAAEYLVPGLEIVEIEVQKNYEKERLLSRTIFLR